MFHGDKLNIYFSIIMYHNKCLFPGHLNPDGEVVTVLVPVLNSSDATVIIKLNYDSQDCGHPSNHDCDDQHREVPVSGLFVEHLTKYLS